MEFIKTTVWDPAEHINTKDDVIAYIEAALEENDTPLLLAMIDDIARSKGMVQIVKDLNFEDEEIYRSLSQEGTLPFNIIVKVLDSLGFQLSIRQKVSV